jgi:hypothetical protein
MEKYLGGAAVFTDGKLTKFKSPFLITIRAFEKYWKLQEHSDTKLVFVPAAKKGYKGGGSFLKSWRMRTDRAKPNGQYEQWSQKKAAKHFGVSQPFIAAIESGEKFMPDYMQREVFGLNATKEEKAKALAQTRQELKEIAAAIKAKPPKKQPKHW